MGLGRILAFDRLIGFGPRTWARYSAMTCTFSSKPGISRTGLAPNLSFSRTGCPQCSELSPVPVIRRTIFAQFSLSKRKRSGVPVWQLTQVPSINFTCSGVPGRFKSQSTAVICASISWGGPRVKSTRLSWPARISVFCLPGSKPSARAISTMYLAGSNFGNRYFPCASLMTL